MKQFKTSLLLALLLVVTGVHAQIVDSRLTRLVEQDNQRRAQGLTTSAVRPNKNFSVQYDTDGNLKSLSAMATLKADAECPTAQLQQMGITVRYVLGDMVALDIPADKLQALENIQEFSFVKADELKSISNDESAKSMEVNKVSTAEAAAAQGLPKAYTGQGVVVGIIDSGIDFNHAAFRNSDGSTRVKEVITYNENTPIITKTDAEIKAMTYDTTDGSHGTHTSAIAAGSIIGNNQQGMAPEADVILCGLGDNIATSRICECIKLIFDYATSVQKPAVVSISLGSITGLHDGSDEVAKTTATLTENGTKQGRAVIISSSNAASNWQSIVKTLKDSEKDQYESHMKTVLGAATYPTNSDPTKPVVYNGNYYFYAADYQEFTLDLAVVDTKTGIIYELGNHVLNENNEPQTKKQLLGYGTDPTLKGGKAFNYWMFFRSKPIHMDDTKYRLVVLCTGKDGQVINMICSGDNYKEPCFDAPEWSTYDFAANGYTKGSGDMTANTSICNESVISVGAYITRNNWTTYFGKGSGYTVSTLTKNKQVIGEIADFSSYCVDDNGINRPTILAPGMGIISAGSNYDRDFFLDGKPGVTNPDKEDNFSTLISKTDLFDRPNWYILEQGTSMAAPAAAGVIALWMQANPKLTVQEIKAILKETCVNDAYTTNKALIPSGNLVQAGYGKLNCLAGLKKIVNTTAIETIQQNESRQATPATMYSVDAPVYNMMGQRVDKTQKGMVIYKGRKYLNK